MSHFYCESFQFIYPYTMLKIFFHNLQSSHPALFVISNKGQALVEYLLIFSFMVFLSISFVRALNGIMTNSIGSLSYELTEQLTVGVCQKDCFYTQFLNQEKRR